MCSELAIKVEKLTKRYKLYNKPSERLWETLGLLRRPVKTFNALSDVSFELKKGEVLGIIGRNGAGKSTLLQLICGTLRPTSGSVQVTGRIAALLELGSGFNPEFSGRDNVYMNASVLGLSKAEIAGKFDDIVSFSELEAFIDQPVKTYSSGMIVRLAFAVATSVEPDILVIDEALSVGDGAFAKKSFDRIMALRDAGTSILFCSHSLYQVETLCSKAIWLKNGFIAEYGDVQSVVHHYSQFLLSEQNKNNNQDAYQTIKLASNDSVSIVSSKIFKKHGTEWMLSKSFNTYDCFRLDITYENSLSEHDDVAIGITFIDKNETILCSNSTHLTQFCIAKTNIPNQFRVSFIIDDLPFLKGDYFISIYLLSKDGLLILAQQPWAQEFTVKQYNNEQGIFTLKPNWINSNEL